MMYEYMAELDQLIQLFDKIKKQLLASLADRVGR